MKKLNLIITLIFFISIGLSAQTPEDALRFSRLNYATGNAKSTSMAGSIGALGANFTSLSINPAGIGVYRNSDLTFTPSIVFSTSSADYLESGRRNDETINFNIGSFGAIFAIPTSGAVAQSGFKYFQFGLGVNRTNNFKRDVLMKGFNETSSITTQWIDDANYNNPTFYIDDEGYILTDKLNLDPFTTGLAFNNDILFIDYDNTGNLSFFSDMEGGQVDQTIRMLTRGSMNEFVISGGFNYSDKLYVGATLGVPYFSYHEQYIITEKESDTVAIPNPFFQSMTYSTNLYTSGSGVNFKIGAIYKPIKWLRVGLALHTPTRYNMDDDYSAEISSYIDLDGGGNYTYAANNAFGTYEYVLRTPLKLIGSLGFVIGQNGSINVDYTFQDYSKAKFKDPAYSYDYTNELISNNYGVGHNIAVGTEWIFGILRVRAGYAYETSPYKSKQINSGGERMTIGAGLGLSFGGFYTDFGYAFVTEDVDFYPYDRYYVEASKNVYNTNQFQLTFGFRF
ncbi:outer membrane protein transport protein [Odoribacter sp. OttesenSCG-928-L07]|nr:outer membrane protein transport protein [Odoribacter sp. OttesenSCG-928-L07]MDL2239234.1 outer membrane protein transport protein [Bacteroidales bacterium OttesenSCG-928-L14]MDL2240052.1 outer membrane protein transport protein [Bacteroidales bacterium OttesenSCG-928-K22]